MRGAETNLRIQVWNVRACMTDRIIGALTIATDVDVFVLSEYRVPKAGDRIASAMTNAGWKYNMHATIPAGLKGVALFARRPLVPATDMIRAWRPRGVDLRQWIVAARIAGCDLTVCGTYVPYADGPLKEVVWRSLIGCARRHARSRVLFAGDFNSGFAATPLPSHRDWITWAGPNGEGNRLDYAFATPALAPSVHAVAHRHDVREQGISDHSAIVLDVRALR
jgi:exonuclease III